VRRGEVSEVGASTDGRRKKKPPRRWGRKEGKEGDESKLRVESGFRS
jgi:hypothetical protein